MKMVELQRCARVALEKCACLKSGERVLVVTDTMREQGVAHALIGATLAAGAEGVLMVIPARRSTPQEPPPSVVAAMQATDIVFLYTTYSLSHSNARVQAQKSGARVISMPGLTEDGFLRTLSVDIDALARLTNRLAERVARSRTARVITPLGTDLAYQLGHPVTAMDGVCEKPGEIDFLPPGGSAAIRERRWSATTPASKGSGSSAGPMSARAATRPSLVAPCERRSTLTGSSAGPLCTWTTN